MLTDGPSDAWILAEVEVDIPAWNEEHRENVNEIECSESLCVGLNLRGSEKATPEAAVRGSRAVSNADCMEATGLTASERVASGWPRDACALVTGGQSCTSPDSMRI